MLSSRASIKRVVRIRCAPAMSELTTSAPSAAAAKANVPAIFASDAELGMMLVVFILGWMQYFRLEP